MTELAPITIDIVSDVMCPWCYIGHKRLEKAMADADDIPVEIRWRPFQLDPTLPPEGRDRRKYLEDKFGGQEGAKAAYNHIREAGAAENIAFAFEKIVVSPNTLDAHRVIRWAASAGEGVQERLVQRLFEIYFEEGGNVGDHKVLVDAARVAGMDAPVVEALLASDADRDAVEQEIMTAQQMGIRGVPCFLLEGRYAVMGAQDPQVLAEAIRKVSTAKAEGRLDEPISG
jgi:predicted DsbA family dithiol-disulfide isomerase